MPALRALFVVALLALPGRAFAQEASFCGERPLAGPSTSVGRPSRGRVIGAVELFDSAAARVLPRRHATRCLNFGTARLVAALARAGARVQRELPGAPQLGVGNLSRARGGPIRDYSHSHQAGRDVDLAFYQLDGAGSPVAADDLRHFGPDLEGEGGVRFDVGRNWALVRALLEDSSIDVAWLFVSEPLRQALLAQAKREKAPGPLLARAEQVLHQPSDAPPHDDHLHLRIACTAAERKAGCR